VQDLLFAARMKGKKFTFIAQFDEYFQREHIDIYLNENGELEVPSWEDGDERWETTGLVHLKTRAVVMTEKEYNKMLTHYEDDWFDWETVIECLQEYEEELRQEFENMTAEENLAEEDLAVEKSTDGTE